MLVPGLRVRLVAAPRGRGDLLNQEGKVVGLIPVARVPLQYNIRVNDEIVVVDANSVELIDYDEKISPPEMLTLNTMTYCSKHRLEICGSCGYHFRTTNLCSELVSDTRNFHDSFPTAQRLEEELKAMGAPIRKAPSKAASSANAIRTSTIPFHAAAKDAIVYLPRNCNPDELPVWHDDSEALIVLKRMFPGNYSGSQTLEEDKKLPLSRLRESIYMYGLRLTEAIRRQGKGPFCITMQDKAQSMALTLIHLPQDIREFHLPNESSGSGDWKCPLFVVQWGHGDVGGNILESFALIASVPHDALLGQITAEVDEILLLEAMLKANAKCLDPAFVQRQKERCDLLLHNSPSRLMNVSAIAPITPEAEKAYYAELKYCHKCGSTTSNRKLLTCSQCKTATYCSRECQRNAWKTHKRTCRSHSTDDGKRPSTDEDYYNQVD
jgi:MYND finger